MFFFEKKNQKTFAPGVRGTWKTAVFNLTQHRPHLRRGNRLAEIRALPLIAANLLKLLKLQLILHAIRQHATAQRMPRLNCRAHNRRLGPALANVLDQRTVQPQRRHRQALQRAQTRITQAEIVQRQPHANALQRPQGKNRVVIVVNQHRLGQLQLQPLRRQARAADRLQQLPHQPAALQMPKRQRN